MKIDSSKYNFFLRVCAMFWRILQGQIPGDSKVEEKYTQIEQESLKLIESENWEEASPYILGMMVATGFTEVKKRPFWDEIPEKIKTELDGKFPDELKKSRVLYQEYLKSLLDQRTSYKRKKDLLKDQPEHIVFLVKNYIAFLKSLRNFTGERVEKSVVGLCITQRNYERLSFIIRKLKFPFLSGIPYFDQHNTWNAEQKLDRIYEMISPEIMEQLTDLDTPFPFESELPEKPVVLEPVLEPVNDETLQSELAFLPRFILSALLAVLTKTGITPVHTKCDNQRYKGCFEDLRERVEQMTSGKIPPNQDTHWNAQHCRNHHGCSSCRALCAMMTILQYPSNPDIRKHIARCVWHGSIFAELAMRHFLIMTLGPTCALAQVVNNPESPHRDLLIQRLTELKVQETPEEKRLREQQDAADRQIEIAEFRHHDAVECRLNEAELRFQEFIYGLGYDPRITGSI